jgi:hypothetical protein
VIEGGRGDHQAGVDGAADDSTERVPGPVVEPAGERFEGAATFVRATFAPKLHLISPRIGPPAMGEH